MYLIICMPDVFIMKFSVDTEEMIWVNLSDGTMFISESGGNYSMQAASGFMDKTSRRDDSLFSRQDTGTPSSSISPFSPSLTADDFPGLVQIVIFAFRLRRALLQTSL